MSDRKPEIEHPRDKDETEAKEIKEVTKENPLKVHALCMAGSQYSRNWTETLEKYLDNFPNLFKMTYGGFYCPKKTKDKLQNAQIIVMLYGTPTRHAKEYEFRKNAANHISTPDDPTFIDSFELIQEAEKGGAQVYYAEVSGKYVSDFTKYLQGLEQFKFPEEFYQTNFDQNDTPTD